MLAGLDLPDFPDFQDFPDFMYIGIWKTTYCSSGLKLNILSRDDLPLRVRLEIKLFFTKTTGPKARMIFLQLSS